MFRPHPGPKPSWVRSSRHSKLKQRRRRVFESISCYLLFFLSEEHTTGARPNRVGSDGMENNRVRRIALPRQGRHANCSFAGPAAELVCEVISLSWKGARESNAKNLLRSSKCVLSVG